MKISGISNDILHNDLEEKVIKYVKIPILSLRPVI